MLRVKLSLATSAACLLVALGVGGSSAPPADAHADCAYVYYGGVGQDRGKACNRSSGSSPHVSHWVDGCDGYGDGLYVRAWVIVQSPGNPAWAGNWDSNGSAAGCANDQYVNLSLYAQKICVEQPVGCSGWLWH
jgi:hypothetical protein